MNIVYQTNATDKPLPCQILNDCNNKTRNTVTVEFEVISCCLDCHFHEQKEHQDRGFRAISIIAEVPSNHPLPKEQR